MKKRDINREMIIGLYRYILTSLIVLRGNHYLAYIYKNDNWYKCNDNRIDIIQWKDIDNEGIRLTWYTKVNKKRMMNEKSKLITIILKE